MENNSEKKSNSNSKLELKSSSTIDKIIEKELERQNKLLPYGYETREQTRAVINTDTGETRFLREYTGLERYFSEPELPIYDFPLFETEIRKRELESKIVKNVLNTNLQKEIDKQGLIPFLSLLSKNKINSILELTTGELSAKLQGNKLLSFSKLRKITSSFHTIQEARRYFNSNNLGFNKYDLGFIYGQILKKDSRISINNKKERKSYLDNKKVASEWKPLLFLDVPERNSESNNNTRTEILREYLKLYC
jgi:hypothetical protein